MNTTDTLRWILTVFFVGFAISLGTLFMFGLMDTVLDTSLVIFKTFFFGFILVVLGTVYISNVDKVETTLEHIFLITSIICLCAASATLAGDIKGSYDVQSYSQSYDSVDELAANTQQYAAFAQSLSARSQSILENTQTIQDNMLIVEEKLETKEPVIIENIITIPAEIIYVEETTAAPNGRDDEEEDDD